MTAQIRPLAPFRERTTLVALLDWTYRRQKADVMVGKGLHGVEAEADGEEGGTFSRGTSSAAAVAANAELGCIIPSTGWQQRPAVHADAVAVVEAVDLLPDGPGRWLVIQHARAGSVPAWGSVQTLEPVLLGGRPQIVEVERVAVRYANRVERDVPVTMCPVEPYPSDAWIVMCREEYRMWHRALTVLAALLDGGGLTRWSLDGVGVDGEPWLSEKRIENIPR